MEQGPPLGVVLAACMAGLVIAVVRHYVERRNRLGEAARLAREAGLPVIRYKRRATLRERLRRTIRFKALRHQVELASLQAWATNHPAKLRITRTSNRLGWLSRGYSPWYDGSVIHRGSHIELFGIPIKKNMTPRNEALLDAALSEWQKANGIDMSPAAVAKRQEADRREYARKIDRYAKSLESPPLLVRLAGLLNRIGYPI